MTSLSWAWAPLAVFGIQEGGRALSTTCWSACPTGAMFGCESGGGGGLHWEVVVGGCRRSLARLKGGSGCDWFGCGEDAPLFCLYRAPELSDLQYCIILFDT